MKKVAEAQNKMLEIFDMIPELKSIFLTSDTIELKRSKSQQLLNNIVTKTYETNPDVHALDFGLMKEAATALLQILSLRSDTIVKKTFNNGYSFVQYINDIVNGKEVTQPNAAFMAELEHLIKSICGKTDIYNGNQPIYVDMEGREAAQLRSSDLSEMGLKVKSFLNRYACGLDSDLRKIHLENKNRIQEYFNATDAEWNNWKWHTNNIIRSAKKLNAIVKLSEEEYQAIEFANEHKIPFGITPYYATLMNYEPGGKDFGIRSQVIPPMHYVQETNKVKIQESWNTMDYIRETDTSPIDGLTRRYPMALIVKPILTCPQICVYCQRNWEIGKVYSNKINLSESNIDDALNWIAERPEIMEVVITGGDPLLFSDNQIHSMFKKISSIKHVERIRIATRMFVTLPQRITSSMIDIISQFHMPGVREVVMLTHFEHLYEITPEAMEAVQLFRKAGIDVYNQAVFTFYNSRKFEAAALRNKLRLIGVSPYYTFNTNGKGETDDYRVPIARLIQEQREEARQMPGPVRSDEIIFNVPKLGKNYLNAEKNHEIVSILPDGRRIYEFHPWEKKIRLMETYVCSDVSIYDYLQRLEALGENIEEYKTIWSYY
jgi:lysine 2,3-aminomutase